MLVDVAQTQTVDFVVVATMRIDFLADCTYANLDTIINEQMVVISGMSDQELQDAIAKPAEAQGYQLSDGLLDAILQDIDAEPNCLPLLEFALQELWENRERQKRLLTFDGYRQMDRLKGALNRHADRLYEQQSASGKEWMRRIFLKLVRTGNDAKDTRQRERRQVILDLAGDDRNERKEIEKILKSLEGKNGRLLVASEENQVAIVDLAHETLMVGWQRFAEWRSQDRDLRRLGNYIEDSHIEWESNNESDNYLLQGVRLHEAITCFGENRNSILSLKVQEFVNLSKQKWIKEEKEKERQILELLMNQSEILWRDNYQLESLIALIKAGKRLQETKFVPDNEILVRCKLHQNLYQRIHEKNRLQGHRGDILSIAFSPDGQTIASASTDETVKLWNLEGKELLTFRGHNLKGFQTQVNCVVFSPDGRIIASGSSDHTVKLWNLEGIEIFTFNVDTVWSIAFSSDSKTLLLAMDNTVKLISLQGEIIHTFMGHKDAVISVAFSPDCKTFASASLDRTVKLWSIEGDELVTLIGHNDVVTSVSFSPDGKTLASASRDKTVKLWNLQGIELLTFTGHSSGVDSVVFSSNGQIIVSGSNDSTVKLWNIRGRELNTFISHSGRDSVITHPYRGNAPMSVAISPDGKTIASASNYLIIDSDGYDGSIKLWNIYGELPLTFVNHKDKIFNVTFAPDGKRIASASVDKTVKLWDLLGNELLTLIGHSTAVFDVAFSPDGKKIASASADKTIKLWDLLGNELLTLIGHDDAVMSIAFSPDGNTVASASADKTVKLWNLMGNELITFRGHNAEVDSIAFSPDGQIIASAGIDRNIKLWNLQGIEIRTFTGHISQVMRIVFSPDGQTIASAGLDNVKLWSLQGLELQTFSVPSTGVSFSPDNKLIALSTKNIELWSLQGEKLHTFLYDSFNGIWGVAFAPNGLSVVLAGGDNTIKLYDIGLSSLVEKGCNWLKDYLTNNSIVSDSDRKICNITC